LPIGTIQGHLTENTHFYASKSPLVAKKFDKTLKNDAIFAEQQGDALFKPLFTNELGSKNLKKKYGRSSPSNPSWEEGF